MRHSSINILLKNSISYQPKSPVIFRGFLKITAGNKRGKMSNNHLLKGLTGCLSKSKKTNQMKKPSQLEAFHGCPKSRIKRRKVRFHGSPRKQMSLPSKRPQNKHKSHGSRSHNRRTKKMTIGWSLRTAMDPEKKIGFLGVHSSKNSSNNEMSLNRCSRRRRTKTTNISTTNSTVAWILTVHKSWIPSLSLILHIRNHNNMNPNNKVTAQVRAHAIHHNKTRFNHLTATLRVKGNQNRSNNLSRESAWEAIKVNKTIWWTKMLLDKAISGMRLTIYLFLSVSPKLSMNYSRKKWLREMPVESRRPNKKLWRFKHQEKSRRSSSLKGKRRTGAFLKESHPQRSTTLTTLGSHLPRKTWNKLNKTKSQSKRISKSHKLIRLLIEAVHQLPNCRGLSRIRNSSLKIRTTNLHIHKIQTKTAAITSRTSTSGWPMRTSSKIQGKDKKVLPRRAMSWRDLSWLEVPGKLVESAKTLRIKHQLGKLPVSKTAYNRIIAFINSLDTTSKRTKAPWMILSRWRNGRENKVIICKIRISRTRGTTISSLMTILPKRKKCTKWSKTILLNITQMRTIAQI